MSLTWHPEGLLSLSYDHLELCILNSSQVLKVLFEGVVMIQWYARKKEKGSEQRILICNVLVLFVQIRSKHLKAELSSLHSEVDFQRLKF